MKTFAAVIGLIVGIAMVWWVRPDNNAGAVFLLVAATAICFVAGVALNFLMGLFRKS